MTTLHHLNCGTLHAPPYPPASCHCILLEDRAGLALVDTGIGLLDCQDPKQRIGQTLIDLAGFQFNEADTAVRQIERLGLRPADVRHIILTHGDPDHVGGVADFPAAQVHIATEELGSIQRSHFRYLPIQFAHGPHWQTHAPATRQWYGLEARPLSLGFAAEVLLIPLFGHTLGHCGVAIQQGSRWTLHIGDAYYLRIETVTDDHPVSQLAAQRADDDGQRRASLAQIKRLLRDHGDEIEVFGYHDLAEFPTKLPSR